MRISDWSSDVCSSDLDPRARGDRHGRAVLQRHLVAAPEALQVRGEKPEVVVALLRGELVGEDHVVGQRLDVDDDVDCEELEWAVLADDVLLNAVEQRSEARRGGKELASKCKSR